MRSRVHVGLCATDLSVKPHITFDELLHSATVLKRASIQVLSESLGHEKGAAELSGEAAQVRAALAEAYDVCFAPAFLLQGFEVGVQVAQEDTFHGCP